jgi:hypothetical protein
MINYPVIEQLQETGEERTVVRRAIVVGKKKRTSSAEQGEEDHDDVLFVNFRRSTFDSLLRDVKNHYGTGPDVTHFNHWSTLFVQYGG